jgi:hypothetical protein
MRIPQAVAASLIAGIVLPTLLCLTAPSPAAAQQARDAKPAYAEPPWRNRLALWRKLRGERTPWRDDPRLRGRFHATASDDIQVVFVNPFQAAADKIEVMWVTVIEHDPATDLFLGILQNAPHHLRDVAEGDNVVLRFDPRAGFLVAVNRGQGHRAAAMPRTRAPEFLEAVVDGVRAYRQGRFGHNMPGIERCIQILSTAVRNIPAAATPDERYAAHFVLARCLAEKYETRSAIENFRAAIALNPTDVHAQMGLLAELTFMVHWPRNKPPPSDHAVWEQAFLDQLALVKARFASNEAVQAIIAAIFDESKAGEMKLSEAEIARNRRYGFGTFRWKQR